MWKFIYEDIDGNKNLIACIFFRKAAWNNVAFIYSEVQL